MNVLSLSKYVGFRLVLNAGVAVLLFFGAAVGVQAAPILSFSPVSQTVGVGDSVAVDINISGLGDLALGTYDLDVEYDSSILSYDSFVFGDQLDLLGFGSYQDSFDLGGVLDLYELSFDFPSDLTDFQLDDFVLGTINFTAVSAGISALSFTDVILGDEYGGAFDADTRAGEVIVASVPEPGSLALLLLGLSGVLAARRKVS